MEKVMDIEMVASLGLASADQLADRAGYPLVFKRHPGAPFHSIDIALDKAYTVVSFGPATGKWDARLAKGSEMLRHGLMQRDRFVGFGGGLPVKHEGVLVGAIGVSGGSEAQDVAFAEAALAGLASFPCEKP
jgi:uncharacterized protein GlcG (DUF336 family)